MNNNEPKHPKPRKSLGERLKEFHDQHKPIIPIEKGTVVYRDKKSQLLHRVDGPAVTHLNGATEWFLNGWRHRVDGPAIEFPDGGKQWWVKGQLHRLDGPASIFRDGKEEYYLEGKFYTKAEHKVEVEAAEGLAVVKDVFKESVQYAKDVLNGKYEKLIGKSHKSKKPTLQSKHQPLKPKPKPIPKPKPLRKVTPPTTIRSILSLDD